MRTAFRCLRSLVILACLAVPAAFAQGQDGAVSFESLLREMTDRSAVARWPEPAYRTLQASSWDRAAAKDGRPHPSQGDDGWFANGDFGKYLREEQRGGRTEKVLMDAEGPGAVVRIWSANPDVGGTLRIYLDGAEEPVIEENFRKLTDGTGPIAPPLSAVRARGHNLYLPIPFEKRCKITIDADKENRLYYIVNYRRYEDGTGAETFRAGDLAKYGESLEAAQFQLKLLGPNPLEDLSADHRLVEPGGSVGLDLRGPGSVQGLVISVLGSGTREREERALRSLVLVIDADDEGHLVQAPLGDFFGSGVGINPFQSWYSTVHRGRENNDGVALMCAWVMPFRQEMSIRVENRGREPAEVWVTATTGDWQWDDRSMYFHADFRQQRNIHTRPRQDFNYLTVEGQGVYVGDTLAVANPTPAWWGEGDEKIFVDREAFPSHFGTGTEDYYGYAWCCPDPFAGPFHAQPRADGPDNFGHVTNSRVRALDAIPFSEHFRFDMEVWHWQEVDVSYAVTTYWYGRPGARAVGPAAEGEMDLAVPQLPEMARLEGVIEGESLEVAGKSGDFPVGRQMLFGVFEGDWSRGAHLWLRPAAPGWVDLRLPTPQRGEQKLTLWLTKAPDYGTIRLSLDGRPIGEEIDLYSERVEPAGPIDLGAFTPAGEQATLRVEIVGKNSKSKGFLAGIDAVRLEPAR